MVGLEEKIDISLSLPIAVGSIFWGLYGQSCRDGEINPRADRDDYQDAVRMGKESVTLALAYRLSGNDLYAMKVVNNIVTWAIKMETRITPGFTNSQSHIELSVSHIGIFYAIDLLKDYAGWDGNEYTQTIDWVRRWSHSAEQWSASNNIEDWRIAFRLAANALIANDKGFARASKEFKSRIGDIVGDNGEMIKELGRSNSLTYSLFAINAMMQSAEIAHQQGVDLYLYKDERGVGLEDVLDFYAVYLLRGEEQIWPYPQMAVLEKKDVAIYELAYLRFKKDSYLRVIQSWGRPLVESRTLQNISFTHSKL